MSYARLNLKNGQVLTGEHMKHIEDGIVDAETADGIYIGSGDMPEGYNVQIDPDADGDVAATQEWVTSQIQAAVNATWEASY